MSDNQYPSPHAGAGTTENGSGGTAASRAPRRTPGAPLSGREREILGQLAEGVSGAQIAERLVLSPETIRTHIRNAMAKLGASSRTQAVALAVQRGEIEPPSDGDAGVEPVAAPTAAPGGRARSLTGLATGKSDATLTALLTGLVSLYDVDGGSVFLADRDGLSLRRVALLGDDEIANGVPPEHVPLGEGPIGRAALERRAQLIHGSGARSEAQGRATICAPMLASGRLVGVICLTTRPSRLTGRGELLLLQAFANRVGEVLIASSDEQSGRLKEALRRFRASWTTSNSGA